MSLLINGGRIAEEAAGVTTASTPTTGGSNKRASLNSRDLVDATAQRTIKRQQSVNCGTSKPGVTAAATLLNSTPTIVYNKASNYNHHQQHQQQISLDSGIYSPSENGDADEFVMPVLI